MNKLNFGTAGIPLSTPDRNTLNGIAHIPKLGLDSMELEFVRSVNIKEDKAKEVKAQAKKHNVTLTAHGQYFINLNAQEPEKLQASIKRIKHAADIANKCGAWSICYHMAHYMKQDPEKVYQKVKTNVKEIVKHLKNTSNPIWIRPETGGKISQFADVDDLIRLSQEVEQVQPCIDWAHQYARSLGKTNTEATFREILEKIEKGLGKTALNNMHMHIEGVEFTDKGEKNHLIFNDSKFNYKDVIKVWKEFNIKGVATCESPNLEEDALTAKKYYAKV
jgi:deoxyribonuclease IV